MEHIALQPEPFLKPEAMCQYQSGHLQVVHPKPFDPAKRVIGGDWPPTAHSMIGWQRLCQLQSCVEDVLAHQVPGDLLEAGVWRGGASILMRGVLKAYGVTDRDVWLADSFAGLPPPDVDKYPQDRDMRLHEYRFLAVSVEQVRSNIAKYGLLDEQVRFLPGWFRDTLATAPIERLAVLRVDGDMYESTMDALVPLYPKLSIGGYVIVDDYQDIRACRQAVDDYRRQSGIEEPIFPIDWTGVYWQRSR
jgi:O-methyltransferase